MRRHSDHRLIWLLHCAVQLHNEIEKPISMRWVLRNLGIGLHKKVDPNAKHGSGAVVEDDGQHKIVLRRSTSKAHPISRRERFTLAHELGHILLLTRFGWSPQTGADYFLCEDWCDLFASHLLVPAIAGPSEFFDPQKALTALQSTATRYNVSYEVAARRITELSSGLAYMSGSAGLNSKKQSVFKVDWATSSIPGFELHRGSHLSAQNPLASRLLDSCEQFELRGVGDVYVRSLDKRVRAAIKSPASATRHVAKSKELDGIHSPSS
jgi:hypothetical protein